MMEEINFKDNLWIAVKVERGFPTKVKAFYTETAALKQERIWRKQMNLDYDETGVFQIKMDEINTQR
jgi:hypothetical protein